MLQVTVGNEMGEIDTDVYEGHEIKWKRHRKGKKGGSEVVMEGNDVHREGVRWDGLSMPLTYLFWNQAELQMASARCMQESRFIEEVRGEDQKGERKSN